MIESTSVDTPEDESEFRMLWDSPYFDHKFYGFDDREEAVRHYLAEGEGQQRLPSREFDPSFYRATNEDLIPYDRNLLCHYIRYGAEEGRYPTRASLFYDLELLRTAGRFDEARYQRGGRDPKQLRLTDQEHYLLFGRFNNSDPNDAFDSGFYLSAYPDVAARREPPYLHFLRVGRDQGRFSSEKEFEAARTLVASAIDEPFYRRQARHLDQDADLAAHYLLQGARAGLLPSRGFSEEYYKRRYSDIGAARVEPFGHYVAFGRQEGRVGLPDFDRTIREAGIEFDRSKPTLLMANHESSRTGAPLVGLRLADQLKAEYNIITYLGRDRGLREEFEDVSTHLIVGPLDELDSEFLMRILVRDLGAAALLANSVETAPIVLAALYAGLPSVALLHEFAEYTHPAGKAADVIAAADRLVVPAPLLLRSAFKESAKHLGETPSNIVVQVQGYLGHDLTRVSADDLQSRDILARVNPGGKPNVRIVFGAGYVQIRKGVDLFVQTAAEVRRRTDETVIFIWVGENYVPDEDLTYSFWIREAIERAGLSDVVFFFPAQSSLIPFFDVTDVFYLPSRLDPYPNVVIDALQAGKPVVCFSGATGAADLFETNQAVGAAVPYCDVPSAAEAIIKLLGDDRGQENRNLVPEAFSFGRYSVEIKRQLDLAHADRGRLLETRDLLDESGAFDATFHEGGHSSGAGAEGRALTRYVARSLKGLLKFSPRPGFNDGLFKAAQGLALNEPICALQEAIALSGEPEPQDTHRCVLLSRRGGDCSGLKIALHIHLHYPDLAELFLSRLNAARVPVDLFVTTTSADKAIQLRSKLLGYNRGACTVLEGPNRGRDIGPFLTSVLPVIESAGYDIVGHLHGKKSLAAGGDMGGRWLTYLIDTLLGHPADIKHILSLFKSDPDLGLVFAEDRHLVGWSDNLQAGEHLNTRMNPSVQLPRFPYFPLGNMFWARPEALRPFAAAALSWDDYPVEPAPNDGTVLHAIERLLPAACEAAGLSWQTVYRRGTGW